MALVDPAEPSLAALHDRARPVAPAGERLLPVPPGLDALLPGGALQRGWVVAVAGGTSLALALVAEASRSGSWSAAVAVGLPPLSPVAAGEVGVALERLLLVSAGPHSGRGGWAWATSAVVDAVDVVVAWPPPHLRAADARRLAARARERGTVLVLAGTGWPDAVDVRLSLEEVAWEGIGRGHGRLLARRAVAVATGRGAAGRQRRVALWLPAPGGGVAPAALTVVPMAVPMAVPAVPT